MPILNILIAPHPILSKKAYTVEVIDGQVRKELDDMVETMYADRGIGLAANQVGILKRMIVMDVGGDNSLTEEEKPIQPKIYKFINPIIEEESEETVLFEEGCLSAPGQRVLIERPISIRLRYLDENGAEKAENFEGLQARCIQHEIDHLNGKTMLEYLSKLKKEMAIKKLMKYYS